MKKTLRQINDLGNGIFLTDKGTIHDYLIVYEALFHKYKNEPINLFEIGYQNGGSALLWYEYFPYVNIRSIDINETCPQPYKDRIRLDFKDIHNLTIDYFNDFLPDIIIDDGSHILEEQLFAVQLLYPILKQGGMLIVEDIKNIEVARPEFDKLNLPYFVIDRRVEQKRYDEVLLIFTKF